MTDVDRPMTAEEIAARTHPDKDPAEERLYFGRHDTVRIDGTRYDITGYCYNNCDLVEQAPSGYDAAAQFALGSHNRRLVLHFGVSGIIPSVAVYQHGDPGWVCVEQPKTVRFPLAEERIRFEDLEPGDKLRWNGRANFCPVTDTNYHGVYVNGPQGGKYRVSRRGQHYRVYRRSGAGIASAVANVDTIEIEENQP